MTKRKLVKKTAKREIDRYPMVAVHWYDILSDASWQSIEELKATKFAECITKGHLLSQDKGVTRIFGDYSLKDKNQGTIEEIGNTTIIPNCVITKIHKITGRR